MPEKFDDKSIAGLTDVIIEGIGKSGKKFVHALKLADPGSVARLMRKALKDAEHKGGKNFKPRARAAPDAQPAQIDGIQAQTAFDEEKSRLSSELTKGGVAGNFLRTLHVNDRLVAEIKDLRDEYEWIRVLDQGHGITTLAGKLEEFGAKWTGNMQGKVGNLAANILGAQTPAQLEQHKQVLTEIPRCFNEYNTIFLKVGAEIKKQVDSGVWETAADAQVSRGKRLLVTGAFSALGVILGTLGTLSVPGMDMGVGSMVAALQAVVNVLKRAADRKLVQAKAGELKDEKGPDYAYQLLDTNSALVAERVCGEQQYLVSKAFDVIAIPATNIPGWKFIRVSTEPLIKSYFKARVIKLRRHLAEAAKQAQLIAVAGTAVSAAATVTAEEVDQKLETIRDETRDFLVNDAPDEFITSIETALRENEEKAANEIRENTAQSNPGHHQYLVDVRELLATMAVNADEIATDMTQELSLNLVKVVVQKVVAHLVSHLDISVAQAVTGADMKAIIKDIDDHLLGLGAAQSGAAPYPPDHLSEGR
ncbi:hypothetical protein [Amycolatopsis sp. NPDC051071]|uniref:hypothetical protein n=1 Tax=Amycolatopsis sp. NPDC051071 TaxID=3154637 RepID=UPI0034387F14